MLFKILRRAVKEENILPLTSTCNLKCVFCSNCQNPSGVEVFFIPPLSLQLVRKLIPLLNRKRKIIIGEAASRISEGEPFTHPEIWTILKEVRSSYPRTLLQITTNGIALNDEAVRRLRDLQPVEINLSLNSSTSYGRDLLMNDRCSEKVLKAVSLLLKYGIRFHGSIVAMPHLVGWHDLKLSCRYLVDNGAATVRIFLPGFTKLAPRQLRFSPAVMYRELWSFVQEQNIISDAPVLLEPFLPAWQENLQPEVAGVLKNSLAGRAGLRKGDVIKAVRGQKVSSRVDAFRLVQKRFLPVLEVSRKWSSIKHTETVVILKKSRSESTGLIMNYDLDWDIVERIACTIMSARARRVLILTSVWGVMWFGMAVSYLRQRTGADIHLRTASNHFFGGSISCAGLLTVLDFKKALLEALMSNGEFDLVLLPGLAFDAEGRDLSGRHYSRLRHLTSSTVKVI